MIKYQDGDKEVFTQASDSRNSYRQPGSDRSDQYNASFSRKSPGLAFLFSFLYPGIGQFYNGQIGKGVAMSVVGTVTLVTGFACANNAIQEDYYGNYYIDEDMLLLASTASVVYFGTWLWSFIDAPVSAGKINRRRERGELSWNVGNGSTLSLNPNLLYANSINGATLRRQPACGLSLKLEF